MKGNQENVNQSGCLSLSHYSIIIWLPIFITDRLLELVG